VKEKGNIIMVEVKSDAMSMERASNVYMGNEPSDSTTSVFFYLNYFFGYMFRLLFSDSAG
jgi:hypothetical protein